MDDRAGHDLRVWAILECPRSFVVKFWKLDRVGTALGYANSPPPRLSGG
jgi:hypothetical protein